MSTHFIQQLTSAHYQSLIKNNPDAIVIVDRKGTFIECNPAAEALLGCSSDDLRRNSNPLSSFLIPSHVERMQHLIEWVYEGLPQETESVIVHKTGVPIFISIKLIPIIIDAETVGVFIIAKDISKLKQAEEELLGTKEQLESLFLHTADAIFILDLKGNVLQINPSFERWFGWKEEEAAGQPLPNLPKEHIKEMSHFLKIVSSGEKIEHAEMLFLTRDGRMLETSISLSPIHNSDGDIIAISGIARDMTNQKLYERKLEEFAFRDTLTGVPNRRSFMQSAKRLWEEAVQSGELLVLLFMDIDKFKRINDTLGHDAGDEVLIQFTSVVQSCLGEKGVLCRLAGDEFVVLLPGLKDLRDAENIASMIISKTSEALLVTDHQIVATASIGLADSSRASNVEQLMKLADEALYEAKISGRNTYRASGRLDQNER